MDWLKESMHLWDGIESDIFEARCNGWIDCWTWPAIISGCCATVIVAVTVKVRR